MPKDVSCSTWLVNLLTRADHVAEVRVSQLCCDSQANLIYIVHPVQVILDHSNIAVVL